MTVSRIEKAPGRFVAHELALEAAVMVFDLVGNVPSGFTDLADQARRAAASGPLNLAEGAGRSGRARVNHYRIAHGSVGEAKTAVRLLVEVGAVDACAGLETAEVLDRVGALSWRLIERPGLGH